MGCFSSVRISSLALPQGSAKAAEDSLWDLEHASCVRDASPVNIRGLLVAAGLGHGILVMRSRWRFGQLSISIPIWSKRNWEIFCCCCHEAMHIFISSWTPSLFANSWTLFPSWHTWSFSRLLSQLFNTDFFLQDFFPLLIGKGLLSSFHTCGAILSLSLALSKEYYIYIAFLTSNCLAYSLQMFFLSWVTPSVDQGILSGTSADWLSCGCVE